MSPFIYVLELPYPPTANTLWRHVGGRVLLSEMGRQYRERVRWAVYQSRQAGRVPPETIVAPVAFLGFWSPPDHRRRDGGNLSKAVLDCLTHAGLWSDDSLVVDERWVKQAVTKGGKLEIRISEPQPIAMENS